MAAIRARVARSVAYGFEGLGLGIAAPLGIPLIVLTIVGFALVPVAGVGALLLFVGLGLTRHYANAYRRWSGSVLGRPIESPYRPLPEGALPKLVSIATDPATWRDLAWLFVNTTLGMALALLRMMLILSLAYGIVLAILWTPAWGYGQFGAVPVFDDFTAHIAPLSGLLNFLLGVWVNPKLREAQARLNEFLLAPAVKEQLTTRVVHLSATRADTVDARAAELRRIERDLHDGAQARLVALGMNLGMAEEVIDRDPAGARAMLTEARTSTSLALSELRDLVRGIHPPVLADRGLDGGIRALALDCPLPVDLDVELAGRVEAPVESAVYFAVAETLTNAAKHSGAGHVWVFLRHAAGRLRVQLVDNGRGGADPHGGSGLAGIQRRLAAFDGTVVVTSPVGGPTVVTLEVPCTLQPSQTIA